MALHPRDEDGYLVLDLRFEDIADRIRIRLPERQAVPIELQIVNEAQGIFSNRHVHLSDFVTIK